MPIRSHRVLAIAVCSLILLSPAASAAPPTGVPVGRSFIDNFDNPATLTDPQKPLWQVSGTVTPGKGIVTIGNPKNHMENTWIATKAFYTGDFTLEVRARLISEERLWGGYGVWFRMPTLTGIYRDGGSGYVFGYVYGDRGVTLTKWPLNHAVAPKVRLPIDNRWHVIKVVARGSRLQGFLDGRLVFDAVDTEFKEGYIGIGTCYRGVVEVDYVRVTVP
ncbi:MAG: family 16 glycoside hydrolase [Armatimonadota bacterium]